MRLYIPWCSVAEAKRTLDRIIKEDIGFADNMARFAASEFRAALLSPTDKGAIDKLQARVNAAMASAMRDKNALVDTTVARMQMIEPSKEVIATTLRLFDTKSLKPFDEMALGAILTCAEQLHTQGETDLHFCTLDKGDLGPSTGRPRLAAAYQACGLAFRPDFNP